MAGFGGGINGLLAQARRAAQRRSQRPSTGHVLLVLLQGQDVAGQVLAARGVCESALLSALKVVDQEPASALEVAKERAVKLASALGEPQARPVHLLVSITRDPRTVGHRCLEQTGAGASKVYEEVAALLDVPTAGGAAPPARPARKSPPRTYATRPVIPPRRPRPAPAADGGTGQATNEGAATGEPASARGSEDGAASPRGRAPAAGAEPTAATGAEPSGERSSSRSGRNGGKARRGRRNVRVRRSTEPAAEPGPFELDPDRYPTLAQLGRNLSALAAAGRIDPVVGRDREVDQLLDVLARRRANNPVLVGAPGVGKTAVVEGLARRLTHGGEGTGGLRGRIIVEVSAGGLVSGTSVRGALAERIKQVREEVKQSEGRIVLFIDEIHAVVGGGSDGPDDLASELKASLARGELPCIGATTEAEYRRCFERDAALARRFSTIQVDEPSPEASLAILEGIAPQYEAHHEVRYEPDALESAVQLSVRWLTEQRLPDKAIGVIDLAAARVRRKGGAAVGRADVASVVAEQARVPAERLLMRDADRLLELESLVGDRVVGHADVIARIADALRKGAAGFRGSRPLGTFLLLGPTGVGKTESAKAVADILFPAGGMTRIDMSEMSEAHAVSRLLGAPPGYVGHEEGGHLTEAVRRRPYQLVLLDEIEKAHPEVLLSLLPLLDEGRLTDGRGRTIDFTNTVVFMTSNLGGRPEPAARKGPIGFGRTEDADDRAAEDLAAAALAAARGALPPELWNRIDEPLFFAPLGRAEVAEIARRMLVRLDADLRAEHGIELVVDETAVDALIAAGGYDAELGARPMRRIVGRLVEAPIAEAVLRRGASRGDTLRLEGNGAEVRLVRGPPAEAAE